MKFFLIGFMGSGKSFLGKKLSKYMNVQFIDLDVEIESYEQKTINEIFYENGESFFRIKEAQYLRNYHDTSFVMATGGGTPCFYDNLSFMKKNGITIYLNVNINTIINNLNKKKESIKRPILKKNNNNELKELAKKRQLYYNQADYNIKSYYNISINQIYEKVNIT